MGKPLVLAHRGFSGLYPENTRRAFMEAVAIKGCSGFEVDVNMTADNEPVIIHDHVLDRTTSGKGPVNAMSYKEIKELDAGAWMDSKFAGEKIMHLNELLELALEHNMLLNIELKSYPAPYKGIEEAVLSRVAAAGAEGIVFMSSFNHLSMKLCKEINPNIPAGLLYMQPLINAEDYATGYALHPQWSLLALEPALTARARAKGVKVHTWTANTEDAMKLCIKCQADGIITNFPDKLAEILNSGSN